MSYSRQGRTTMSQRSTGPAGPPAGGEWPDELWPADDEVAGQQGDPAAGSETQPGGTPPLPPGWPGADGTPRARWLRPGVLATVVIAGAVAGAVVAAAVMHSSSGPAASGQPPAVSQQQPGGNGAPGGGGTLPGGAPPGGGPGARMFVIGTVNAVSGTSITIGGQGHTITAMVTHATRVTGKVAGLSGIKVGDQISAQLTQDGGRVTAVTIADPAQAPAGGSLP
jgi:hypothetical protein